VQPISARQLVIEQMHAGTRRAFLGKSECYDQYSDPDAGCDVFTMLFYRLGLIVLNDF
jgi:hypothetical protein